MFYHPLARVGTAYSQGGRVREIAYRYMSEINFDPHLKDYPTVEEFLAKLRERQDWMTEQDPTVPVEIEEELSKCQLCGGTGLVDRYYYDKDSNNSYRDGFNKCLCQSNQDYDE